MQESRKDSFTQETRNGHVIGETISQYKYLSTSILGFPMVDSTLNRMVLEDRSKYVQQQFLLLLLSMVPVGTVLN
jgi:hypothetical protein